MKVEEVMTEKLVEARTTNTLREAIWFMEQHGVRHLLVREEDGALAGIVSDRDLRLLQPSPAIGKSTEMSRALEEIDLGRAMTSRKILVSIGPDDDVAEAASRLLDNWVSALPVMKDGEVVGIVSTTDLLRLVAGRHVPARSS